MLILCFISLLILLLFPEMAAEGSKNGLILWATVLVPSLLPFSVLTSLIRRYMQGKPFKYLLIAAGVLSGYPIGAKIAGELYMDGSLTQKKALFFAGFTNNPSPMFVIFFVAGNMLHLSSGKYIFYVLVLLSSFLGSLVFMLATSDRTPAGKKNREKNCRPSPSTPSHMTFSEAIDMEISSSALLLIKIGGYIMLFSILATLIKNLSLIPLPVKLPVCGLLEITTGNSVICQSPIPDMAKKILCLVITTFGGLSAATQTNGVLQNTGLSISRYIIIKLISGVIAVPLAFFFLNLAAPG